jgi:hypothetical protein
MLREPRVDDHLVEPEVTRDEIIGGVRVALPADSPHALQQTELDYLLRAHVVCGYRVAVELLTRHDHRHDQESDFATGRFCVQGRQRLGDGPSTPGGDRL